MESLIHEKFRTGTDKTTTNKIVVIPQSGLCPPHNFIQTDSQWSKCTYCGEIKPIYKVKVK